MFQARTAKGFLIEVPLVFNNYQIMNQIKSGAFSVVVKVKDQETKEMLAAKIISKKDMKKRKAIKIINKEIELLQKINHPNIVKLKKVLEIENENEEEFIIMIEEYCSQGDLSDNIIGHRIRTEKEKKRIAQGIIEAIAYLHKRRIAHCDIKPSNILLDENNIPKLCDFNLSICTRKENVCYIAGTPLFQPPELHANYYYGNRMKADIWSLGVTLFYLFENRLPFHNYSDLRRGQCFLSENNINLNRFILKCLQINEKFRVDAKLLKNDEYLVDGKNIHQQDSKRQKKNVYENIQSIFQEDEYIYSYDIKEEYEKYEIEYEYKDKCLKKKYDRIMKKALW